jgi:hypothetical protein
MLTKTSRVESLSNAHGSNITLGFGNGACKRICLQLQINNFLVRSIMKTFKIILPSQLYESLN